MGRAILSVFKTKEEAEAYLKGYLEGINEYEKERVVPENYIIYYEPDDYPDEPFTLNLK